MPTRFSPTLVLHHDLIGGTDMHLDKSTNYDFTRLTAQSNWETQLTDTVVDKWLKRVGFSDKIFSILEQ